MLFWNSRFFDDPMNVGNLISGSSAFSKTSLNIRKFKLHILLKPGLENFEHYFTSVWDECNCAVVWTFFGIAFLWDWNENWPFPALWPLLSFPNLLAYWVQHFHSIIFQDLESAICVHIFLPFGAPSPLPTIPPLCTVTGHQAGPLCWTAAPHELSVSHMAMCICQWHSLNSSHPLCSPICHKSVLHICVSIPALQIDSVQFSSVAQSCPTLFDPMSRSTPGLPVHHQLPEFTETHVHWVSDDMQPSHPLSSPSPPAPNPSQHQSFFQWVNSLHEVAKVLEFQL